MPFRLKNAGVTYQRAINAIFHEFISKFMEVYIDDVVVKSYKKDTHLDHLRIAFERIRKQELKINPLKYAFGVVAGNFLGFIVHKKGSMMTKKRPELLSKYHPQPTKSNYNLSSKKLTFCDDSFRICQEGLESLPHW